MFRRSIPLLFRRYPISPWILPTSKALIFPFTAFSFVISAAGFSTVPSEIVDDIDNFWFQETDKTNWFFGGTEFDESIKIRFGSLLESASKGELDVMASSARGCLMLIILLDQFSRNIHRGSSRSYENDEKARRLCYKFIESGFLDDPFIAEDTDKILFAILPLMHSEDLKDHEMFLEIATQRALGEETMHFERLHVNLLQRFGRYPHRNSELGRQSTEEEQVFLDTRKGMFE